jgi:hypothetical protein
MIKKLILGFLDREVMQSIKILIQANNKHY